MENTRPVRFSNIGVDTGGTFTDLVLIDAQGIIRTEKSFSTPDSREQGVFDVLERAARTLNTSVSDILSRTDIFAHGTTASTNALIQRRGARVGVLFTSGFEDTLAIARGPIGRVGGLPQSQAMDFIHTEPPAPIVPRDMVRGVVERIGSDGRVVTPLNETDLRASIEDLISEGAESLAVCLLWAFRNAGHEERVAAICTDVAPGIPVSLSHQIAPKMGEFERAVTTVINAYIGPLTQKYIGDLNSGLATHGLSNPIQVITSTGGAARAANIGKQAVSIVNSGPVGGLVAARFLGDQLGHEKIITADMGGTSFDVGLIDGDTLEEDPRPFLDHGLPVSLPTVKLVTIGAGGGSIAWTDGYRLHVGPQSAGADPGPAAYSRGGAEPTVTDALVVCGIVDPENFFGGAYKLDRDLSERAIADRIAMPLGLDLAEAAAGILEIVNARMANLIRKVSIESGHDPSAFALYAYGGATGAHCAEFARHLGIGELILPYAGPVFSALGVAIADIAYSHTRSEPMPLAADRTDAINANFTALRAAAAADMEAAGINPAACTFRHRIEMRYRGQMNEVTLDWPSDRFDVDDIEVLRDLFEAYYQKRFGASTIRAQTPLELISFRVEATHPTSRPALAALDETAIALSSPKTRPVYLRDTGFMDADIIDFAALKAGPTYHGPAVIERDTTTIWLPPGASATMDTFGNLAVIPQAVS
ncbi:MAG: hydantoinase/oxoprolinase family protein [Alphaproteobacteria bacterium]|nr:hydantoinase/oxoprolinase family protein [Alphaproteobacteria bacterium]